MHLNNQNPKSNAITDMYHEYLLGINKKICHQKSKAAGEANQSKWVDPWQEEFTQARDKGAQTGKMIKSH